MNLKSSSEAEKEEESAKGNNDKCSKMLSQLLSNQAASTANTMKILSSLLKDDGCSLSSGEQQVAAKMMGKLMNGKFLLFLFLIEIA